MNLAKLLQRFPQLPLLTCLLVGVLISVISVQLMKLYADSRGRAELTTQLEKMQESLSVVTTRSRSMGMAMLLGLNEPILKHAARNELGLDSPDVLKRLNIGRQYFGFEGLYVIDQTGLIVANDTDGAKSTGKSIAFRPYFQQAIKGKESIYLAIGTNSDSRGLYVAAPIHATEEVTSDIIGVISIKISAEELLDQILANAGGDALLLSPQGVVFAATNQDWLLSMTPPASDERLHTIRDLKQFGRRFAEANPSLLDFTPTTSVIEREGKHFLAEHSGINFNDPSGSWTLVLMKDIETWLPGTSTPNVVFGIMLIALVIGSIVQQQIARVASLKQRLSEENQERELAQQNVLAAAEERAMIAKIIAELRQVQNYAELVTVFMRHASELFNVRHGLLYVTDPGQQLRLIGGYGVAINELGKSIAYGEGLAGQCALEERALEIHQPPADYINIHSGTGGAAPKVILLRPLLLNDKLVGVLELAAFSTITSQQEKILCEFEAIVAANIELIEQRLDLEQEFMRQQESEAQMRYQSLFQQALIDAIPFPIFYKGADSYFLGFNKAYEQVFNVKRDGLIGKRVIDLEYLPLDDRKAYQQEDEQVIRQGSSIRREIAMPFADGTLHKTLYSVSGFSIEDGQPGGLVGIFIDLKDRINEE
ncbi:PAS domain-containing protein [Cellvibrio sp. NN19]|uniref:PAS domain-containing protein n=1 Tax=Cellvibrio chitinivorans TaxID=3102792 RepID=UPI002B40A14F|nr:PAS domain-containing protein [Cellvibrio sp. NN19]